MNKKLILLLAMAIFFIGFSIEVKALTSNSYIGNIGTLTQYEQSNQIRQICRDSLGYLHVVYAYNVSQDWNSVKPLVYAKSTDNGVTWVKNNSFWPNSTNAGGIQANSPKGQPSISCDGNNISVVYVDMGDNTIKTALSTDNGITWKWDSRYAYCPSAGSCSAYWVVNIERRGQKVYIVWLDNYYFGSYQRKVHFYNSTDGGLTWGSDTQLNGGGDHRIPSLFVSEDGSKIDILSIQQGGGNWHYWSSADYGTTFTGMLDITPSGETIQSTQIIRTDYDNNLWIVYGNNSHILMFNSTNQGLTWNYATRLQVNLATYPNVAYNPVATVDNTNNSFYIIWHENITVPNYMVVYRKWDIRFHSIDSISGNINNYGSKYANIPRIVTSSGYLDAIWLNGTYNPPNPPYDIYQLLYNNLVTYYTVNLTITTNTQDCGIFIPSLGTHVYNLGASVTITVYPICSFNYWLLDDGTHNGNTSFVYVMNYNRNATAIFNPLGSGGVQNATVGGGIATPYTWLDPMFTGYMILGVFNLAIAGYVVYATHSSKMGIAVFFLIFLVFLFGGFYPNILFIPLIAIVGILISMIILKIGAG